MPPKSSMPAYAFGVVVVLEESRREEVAGEAVAFRARVAVVQVDRDLVDAERRVRWRRREVVGEAYQRRHAVKIQRRRRGIPAVERPHVGRQQVRVMLMQRRRGHHAIRDQRQELLPALMRIARCFAGACVGRLRRQRAQDLRQCRQRHRKRIHERPGRRAHRCGRAAQYRLCERRRRALGEHQRLLRCQDRRRAEQCAGLEHRSSVHAFSALLRRIRSRIFVAHIPKPPL